MKKQLKTLVMGGAFALTALAGCSSSPRTTDDSLSGVPTVVDSPSGKQIAAQDDTVERRNANYYQSSKSELLRNQNRTAATTPDDVNYTNTTTDPAPASSTVQTTQSSAADLGASSSGMGK